MNIKVNLCVRNNFSTYVYLYVIYVQGILKLIVYIVRQSELQ